MAKYIDGNDFCEALTKHEIDMHLDVTGEVPCERRYSDVLGDVLDGEKERFKTIEKTCKYCGDKFKAIIGNRKTYCSDRCAVRFRKERREKNERA